MDQRRWSLQDAKNHFSAVVAAAVKGWPQTVTKHGKPAVVVLSLAEYESMMRERTKDRPSFVEHLLAMPQGGRKIGRARIKPRNVNF